MRSPYEEDVQGTDWSKLTVRQMWDALGEFDQQPATEQAPGWVMAMDLLDHHRGRLEQYRDMVAQAWRGPTADAFLAEVNGLIMAVKTMRDAAIANEAVLPHLSGSMVEARAALAPIYTQWAANDAKLAAAAGRPAGSGGLQGSHSTMPQPAAQTQLHREAVDVMGSLSSQIIEGYKAVKIPPPYEWSGFDTSPSHPAPPSGSAASGGAGSPHRAPFSPVPTSIGSAAGARGTGLAGNPALAGQPATSVSLGASGLSSSPAVVRTTAGSQPVVGRVIGQLPPPSWIEAVGSGGAGRVPGTGPSGIRSGSRPLAPGGVINGPPEGVEPVRGSVGAPRANPAGGVIGPATGRETEGMFPPVGGAGGRLGSRRQAGRNRDYDTDEHWPVPTGVPPVIGLPGEEPTHDPGIPVIGLPRERRGR